MPSSGPETPRAAAPASSWSPPTTGTATTAAWRWRSSADRGGGADVDPLLWRRRALPGRRPKSRSGPSPLALGLHDVALNELQFARRVYGETPPLMATIALAQHRAGRLRPGINAMKRAYPQWMASGGESLPADVLRLIFPIDYWQQLEGSAKRRELDCISSSRWRRRNDLRRRHLVVGRRHRAHADHAGHRARPGPQGGREAVHHPPPHRSRSEHDARQRHHFADLDGQFGHAAYALAGYNAGGHRVVRWKAERGELPIDEWIDDIPFPETQNYVKRILGTAEDYRRLYGGGVLAPVSSGLASPAPPKPAPAKAGPAKAPAKKRAAPGRRPPTRPRRPGV